MPLTVNPDEPYGGSFVNMLDGENGQRAIHAWPPNGIYGIITVNGEQRNGVRVNKGGAAG